MAKRPANPNTSYGRRRIRQEYHQMKEAMSPDERSKQNSGEFIIFIILMVFVGLIVFLFGGSNGLLKWLSH